MLDQPAYISPEEVTVERAERDHATLLFDGMTDYGNDRVTAKLQSELSLSPADAALLFQDLKRFLALCAGTSVPLAPPRIVDQAWHQFILFTRDYAAFCNEFCGRFIHHQPANPIADEMDYSDQRHRTRDLATAVFGSLSSYWKDQPGAGNCTHNCGTGD
jgi:hypothetical protein